MSGSYKDERNEGRRVMVERTLYITDYCPAECDFCSSDAGPKGITFDDVDEALAWLEREGATFVHVSGGEAIYHPEFPRLWKALRERYGDNLRLWSNEIPQLGYNKHVRHKVELHPAVIATEDDTQLHVLKEVRQGRAAPKVTLSGQWRGACKDCDHKVRLPDGTVRDAPCKKDGRAMKGGE